MQSPPGFDAYHKWLGIPPAEQPPNHYRLLGIPLYEDDPSVIESGADRQIAHVQTYRNGPHAQLSQKLADELKAARLCLLSSADKRRYDDLLRRTLSGEQGIRRPPPVPGARAATDNLPRTSATVAEPRLAPFSPGSTSHAAQPAGAAPVGSAPPPMFGSPLTASVRGPLPTGPLAYAAQPPAPLVSPPITPPLQSPPMSPVIAEAQTAGAVDSPKASGSFDFLNGSRAGYNSSGQKRRAKSLPAPISFAIAAFAGIWLLILALVYWYWNSGTGATDDTVAPHKSTAAKPDAKSKSKAKTTAEPELPAKSKPQDNANRSDMDKADLVPDLGLPPEPGDLEADIPPLRVQLYLDELQEADFKVGRGSLGKHGSLGFQSKNGPKHVNFQGRPAGHALATFPPANGSAQVTYALSGQLRTFRAVASARSKVKRGIAPPVHFKLFGDGKLLWESRALVKRSDAESCNVDIEGVKSLTLQVESAATDKLVWAAWIDPSVE